MGTYVPYNPETEQFLNNFYTRFPSGWGQYPQGLARMTYEVSWETTFQESLRGVFRDHGEDEFIDYCSKLSDRYLAETPEQFFNELDKTVQEVGLSLERVAEIIREFKAANEHLHESVEANALARQCSNNLNAYLTPAYVALRRKGYNRKELWG